MGATTLSSRAIIGNFYKTLEQDPGIPWVNAVSMYFDSDQASETYNWLGQTPAMREWVGGRNAKGFRENGITVTNKHYESTLNVETKDLRRDKTGQVQVRIDEQVQRANSHWASLLSTLIENGTSTVCYDGQFFFDTDHSEGDSGTQSNDITTDISGLPASVHGSTTAPSPEEVQQTVMKSIAQILSFKDDQGEPMNENASSFVIMVPVPLYIPFVNGLTLPKGTGVSELIIPSEFSISVLVNPRLTGTDDFYTFRADGGVKPFIRQEEVGLSMSAKAEGSEYEFDNAAHQYGIDSWRNVGYGYWQHACYNQMT